MARNLKSPAAGTRKICKLPRYALIGWMPIRTKLVLLVACLPIVVAGCHDRVSPDLSNPSAGNTSACRPLASVVGPEDFAVDKYGGRLLVSSRDRRNPSLEGAIYSVSLDGSSNRRLSLAGRDSCSFRPHGVFLASTTPPTLYVINYHKAEDASADAGCVQATTGFPEPIVSIEVFAVFRWELRFLRRLMHPAILKNANDLVADDEGNVYITAPPRGVAGLLRDLTAKETGSSEVVEFRCQPGSVGWDCIGQWSNVATVGRYVNGIALLQEGSETRLVVSSTLDGRLVQLRRTNGAWQFESLRRFGIGHDNLMWLDEEPHTLLVASHPDLRRFSQHSHSSRVTSPSLVWKVPLDGPGSEALVFSDDGTMISAASTAACVGDSLILGQVFGGSVLKCKRPDICGPR